MSSGAVALLVLSHHSALTMRRCRLDRIPPPLLVPPHVHFMTDLHLTPRLPPRPSSASLAQLHPFLLGNSRAAHTPPRRSYPEAASSGKSTASSAAKTQAATPAPIWVPSRLVRWTGVRDWHVGFGAVGVKGGRASVDSAKWSVFWKRINSKGGLLGGLFLFTLPASLFVILVAGWVGIPHGKRCNSHSLLPKP